MSFGVGPQRPVSIDVPTGFGLNLIGVAPVHNEGPVPVFAGAYDSLYSFLPWW